MKRYFSSASLLLAVLLILSACGGKSGRKSAFMATSSGRPYEILVVVDLDLWERPAGRALYDVLDTDVPGLPQSERSFRMMYSAPQNYDATLKLIRNIIIVDINKEAYTQPKFRYAKDVYAAPQMILTIQAPDEESFKEFVTEQKQTIIDFFTRAEMNREMVNLESEHNQMVDLKVKELFGCDVWVPLELGSSKQGENFFWAATNTATADRNFVIYSYPYRDRATFTKEYFIHKRDSVMKINIPGAYPDSYMTTDSLLTDVRPITVQGKYAFEARGLWRMTKDMMGGPFVSHARLDTINQRIIVAEIFVYSPDKLKRNLVRGMEASLYTLRLPAADPKQEQKVGEIEEPTTVTKN
jgi:hypothetical protein